MRSRLNHTGRRRITRNHAQVSVRAPEGEDAPIFDASLDLSSYGFPDDARVRVEAWRSNAVQRWDYGTAGALEPPSDEERQLTDVPASAQFRVIVVDGDGSGLLLGHAPNIRPVLPRRSLLPVRESDELGDEVWRVDFGDGMDRPELLINPSVDGISEIVRSDEAFRSLVMPDVLRTILAHVVLVERQDPDDDEGPWGGWFEIARALLPDEEPPRLQHQGTTDADIADANRWIDRVVAAFADVRLDAADAYNTAMHRRRS